MHLRHQNLHRDLLERASAPALTTVNGVVMSVVYVTAEPTFTGVIGGYSTVNDDSLTAASQSTFATRSRSSVPTSSQQLQSSTPAFSQLSSTSPTATASIPSITGFPSTSADSLTNTGGFGPAVTDSATTGSSSDGMSTGAKIGLGAGIICGIGAIAVILLLLLAKKKRQQEQKAQELTEKKNASNQPQTADVAGQFTPKAPRLSLRPVSGLAEFIGNAQKKNRFSQGNTLNSVSEVGGNKAYNLAPIASGSRGPNSLGRPTTGDNPFKDPENPFADPEKAMGNMPVSPVSPPATAVMPVAATESPRDQRTSGPTAESFPIPQSQSQMSRQNSNAGPTSSSPSTVTHHELPASAPSPVVARGPGPGPGSDAPQGNVYRILMDFRPTMDDELELRAGQLVRMLHEYDDGWALCIRLDRSQQGVVPRTCLAAKPSKPRPGPPPMGPNSHPMSPQGRPRGPPGPGSRSPQFAQGPGPMRAQSPVTVHPNTGAFNQTPRPLSPGPRPQPPPQKRTISPGPDGADAPQPVVEVEQKQRSNSIDATNTPDNQSSPPAPGSLTPGTPVVRSNSPGLAM